MKTPFEKMAGEIPRAENEHDPIDELLKDSPPMLTAEEVAALGIFEVSSLAVMRCRRSGGPPFLKVGRSIRYLKSDLADYLRAARVTVEPTDGR